MKKLTVLFIALFTLVGMVSAQSAGGTSSRNSSGSNSRGSGNVVIPKKEYVVRNAGSNKYWDIPGGPGYDSGSDVVQIWDLDGGKDRKVMFIPAGGGYYYIKFSHNGYYLDVSGGNFHKGSKIQIWQPNRSDAQKFKVVDLGGGKFKFLTVTGHAIDIKSAKISNGTDLHLWDSHGGNSQKFEIIEANTKRKFYN